MRNIFLIVIGLSSLVLADFTRYNDNTIYDGDTGLTWIDYNVTNDDDKQITWQTAIDYCEGLNHNGQDNWRLPNVNELSTLVKRGPTKPAIDGVFQSVGYDTTADTDLYYYWSSTTDANHDKASAWVVDFKYGLIIKEKKTSKEVSTNGTRGGGIIYARCVRGGV